MWKAAHQAVMETYRITCSFPGDERFALVLQMRKAAVSIPANIAESFGRLIMDKAKFLVISQGFLEELRYYLISCGDLGLLKETRDADHRLDETAGMLRSMIHKMTAPGFNYS